MFQIARELRLRDIGGIIIVDFIDMADDCELLFCLFIDWNFLLYPCCTREKCFSKVSLVYDFCIS